MKVAILAGGKGTRLAEETSVRPKPMVEIGGMPILWHIMKIYSHYGFNDFAVALGYKGNHIKRYFAEYGTLAGNITINLGRSDPVVHHEQNHSPWSIDLIETGSETLTGGRVKRLQPYLGDSTFMLTWGDGVSDVDLNKLLAFHRHHGKLATITAVRPPARYGHMRFEGDKVTAFEEKPQTAEGWINGAFFILEPEVFDYIEGDMMMFEHGPLENLAKDGQLMAYRHDGFWAAMDTLRDKYNLQKIWDSGERPWAVWEK
ncbi:glucose-1-phosphate cytidylyltransferase [Aliiroseovarius subalbicans]|uniref:glucose-1-phosphate cytidylyltransferase n=1 Tax=Aliiroseovarius subalbicans TaxID=2925840 RepID=UPI001F5746EE|nr:glucose-1-phosphate cytidylyltransferase [Aliiroseovarius subalbicans]MCI2401183.1 glucose-1-phosphate cytidylyltransferase [Aliiroseovarius subalbicans]